MRIPGIQKQPEPRPYYSIGSLKAEKHVLDNYERAEYTIQDYRDMVGELLGDKKYYGHLGDQIETAAEYIPYKKVRPVGVPIGNHGAVTNRPTIYKLQKDTAKFWQDWEDNWDDQERVLGEW